MLKGLSTVAPAAAVSAGAFGAFIVKKFDVTDVSPVAVKFILAPVTRPRLLAVIVLKITGFEEVIILLPAVQGPDPATAFPVIVAEPEAALP